jgi:hypothetical protein
MKKTSGGMFLLIQSQGSMTRLLPEKNDHPVLRIDKSHSTSFPYAKAEATL